MQYILRTCNEDMTSYKGFQWPTKGKVTAPDWVDSTDCGNGLHGFLNGEGNGELANCNESAKWLVCSVRGKIINLNGKVKFKSCNVLFVGSKDKAIAFLKMKIGNGFNIIGDTVTGGDFSTVTGGYHSTVTGGNDSTVTGGNGSTVTGGDFSTVTGGNGSTVTGGDFSTVTGGNGSTVTGGYGSTVTGGDGSTVTGGYGSTVTGGNCSTVTGGYGSILQLIYFDNYNRKRIKTEYIGENGIKSNTKYKLDSKFNFVEVKEEE